MARWLNWLERPVHTREVEGPSISVAGMLQDLGDGLFIQLGEHLPYKQRVTGSSPVGPILLKDINQYGEVAQLARASGSYPGG